jgi:plasmid stabilization system protein ParE
LKLVWAAPAQADLHALADFYRQIDVKLSDRMRQRIERTPALLTRFPRMGTPLGSTAIRKLRVRHTPFVLYYQLEPDRIVVLRVIHAAHDIP